MEMEILKLQSRQVKKCKLKMKRNIVCSLVNDKKKCQISAFSSNNYFTDEHIFSNKSAFSDL